jgi:hypothetical protein
VVNSPLGKYAPLVAAVVCGGTIAVYLFALLFTNALHIDPISVSQLHDLAILAFGAVVGSAVAVNGWKQPLSAAHSRIDKLELQTAIATHDTDANVTSNTERLDNIGA